MCPHLEFKTIQDHEIASMYGHMGMHVQKEKGEVETVP